MEPAVPMSHNERLMALPRPCHTVRPEEKAARPNQLNADLTQSADDRVLTYVYIQGDVLSTTVNMKKQQQFEHSKFASEITVGEPRGSDVMFRIWISFALILVGFEFGFAGALCEYFTYNNYEDQFFFSVLRFEL